VVGSASRRLASAMGLLLPREEKVRMASMRGLSCIPVMSVGRMEALELGVSVSVSVSGWRGC
jgi:hypothetical protein